MTSLYDISVGVYIRSLEGLAGVLKAGEKWADENDVEHSKLIEARLAPDMHALPFQVQTASNTAKSILSRIGDQEPPKMEDNETTFAQLHDRVQKTIEALKSAKRVDFDGKESKEIDLFGRFKFSAVEYLVKFGLPNFFFHVTTAYDILRNQGVPLSKWDFLGTS